MAPRFSHRLLSLLEERMRTLAFRKFSLARAYTHALLTLSPPARPLFVYSMGKVGSSSLARSLESAAPEFDVFHLHWLIRKHLDRDERLYRQASRAAQGSPDERRFRPGYIWAGQYFSSQIHEPPPGGGKWTVVTAVRDPVARNVSSFFQNLRLFFDYQWPRLREGEAEDRAIGELRALFHSSFLSEEWVRKGLDSNPLTWLDTELRPAFGIDVFQEPFPRGLGYQIFSGTRARVLLFRLEDMDRCARPALEEFLGIRDFTLLPRNVASEKGYASLYRRFLDSLVLPDEYLDRIYDSRFSRHFYSERELAAFKNRWRTIGPSVA